MLSSRFWGARQKSRLSGDLPYYCTVQTRVLPWSSCVLVGRDADTVNMNSSYDYKSLRGICVLIPVLGTQNSGTWTRWGG